MTAIRPVLHREGVTANGRQYVIRPSQEGDAPGLAALMDAVAAEGELIAAVPGEPDTIEQSTRLVSIVLEGGLTLTLEDGEGQQRGSNRLRLEGLRTASRAPPPPSRGHGGRVRHA